MNCRLLIFVFLFFSPFALNAKPGNISGKVKNNENKVLASANIFLLNAKDNKLVKADLSDEKGIFSLPAIPDGEYILKVTSLGYGQYSSQKITITNADVQLDDIVLQSSTTLKEVAVRAQKPFIEVQADKIVVNVENSITSAGSSAMEILMRSPGVKVDQNDNISLKGKQGVNVMIDGKIQPISGQDLANVLKSMPANSIDKIELISNPGARYDAAGTAGIINIRTKKDQRLGTNGTVNMSYGQGVYPKYSAGANLNYRDRKINVYANYNYSCRYWFNHLILDRRFYDTGVNAGRKLFSYKQDNFAMFDFQTHLAAVGLDYNISRRTTVGVGLNGSSNWFHPRANNASKALGQNDELLYNFNTEGKHTTGYYNYAANLNLRHSFDSTGKDLSVDADYIGYTSTSNQNFVTNYVAPDGSQYLPDYYLKSDLKGLTQIRSIKADYTNPLKNNARFEAGIKSSYVTADNNPLFYEKINGDYQLDAKRSNHFIYNENINAAYVNFNKDWTKWSTQIGVRTEQTNASGNQVTTGQKFDTTYTQLFPSIALQRHINTNHDLGMTLSRRIERPNYQQLNPFKYFIDKTTYREGYPYLIPASCYMLELSHTFKQRFITTLTYAQTKNIIVEVIQPSDNEDSVTVQTNKNLKRLIFYGLNGAYNTQITKWWSNVSNFNIYYSIYEGYLANTNIRNGAPTFDINTTNTFILPKEMSAELSLFYQARQLYGFMDVKPNWMLSVGVQRNFWNKKATLKLNVQDIFWKGYPAATSIYTGYQEDFVAIRETRQATISFVYRFGKKTVAPVRKRNGGAEDEKRRAASGNA